MKPGLSQVTSSDLLQRGSHFVTMIALVGKF